MQDSEEMSVQENSEKEGITQVKIDNIPTFHPPMAPSLADNIIMTTTVDDDYDAIFKGMDPNAPIRPCIPGVCEAIVPNVKSWQELISDFTVPRPRIWQSIPIFQEIVVSTSGGVSTSGFSVRREPIQERVHGGGRVEERDNYRRVGRTVTVRARNIVAQGTIQMEIASPDFVQVSQEFAASWLKGAVPQIKYIFKICNRTLEQNFLQYKQELTTRGHPQESEPYYHGTDFDCDLGNSQAPCNKGSCGICGITCAGMDPSFIRNDSFQRFGQGFYLAPHSSKCNDYTRQNGRGHKAMLLCQVLPGKKYQLSSNSQKLERPPAGYDSVYGVVGTELNFPEIVVYDKRAVLPKFIIIYQ